MATYYGGTLGELAPKSVAIARAERTVLFVAPFDTIGGLILGQLGRAPEVGDEVHLHGYILRVEEANGPAWLG